jgi:hypothetical protein
MTALPLSRSRMTCPAGAEPSPLRHLRCKAPRPQIMAAGRLAAGTHCCGQPHNGIWSAGVEGGGELAGAAE